MCERISVRLLDGSNIMIKSFMAASSMMEYIFDSSRSPHVYRVSELFSGSCVEYNGNVKTVTRHDFGCKGANLSKKLIWMEERIAAFKECQIAVSNCQQL